jgi:PII-like signaling protein
MTLRALAGQQSLLRIYVGDFDKYRHHSLYRSLVELARASGLAGCTVIRAFEGYGAGRVIHSEIALEGAGERPVVVECVDSPERVGAFLERAKPLLRGGIVTEEPVTVHQYARANGNPGDPAPAEVPMRKRERRTLSGEQTLLRIFVGESDKAGRHPLHEAILREAHRLGLAGCTAIRGVMGFGANSVIHTDQLLRLSSDLPIVVEIVDSEDRVHQLLNQVRPLLQEALVTEAKVRVHHYAGGSV